MASLSCFLIFWIEYLVLIYVNNKFCNQNLGADVEVVHGATIDHRLALTSRPL